MLKDTVWCGNEISIIIISNYLVAQVPRLSQVSSPVWNCYLSASERERSRCRRCVRGPLGWGAPLLPGLSLSKVSSMDPVGARCPKSGQNGGILDLRRAFHKVSFSERRDPIWGLRSCSVALPLCLSKVCHSNTWSPVPFFFSLWILLKISSFPGRSSVLTKWPFSQESSFLQQASRCFIAFPSGSASFEVLFLLFHQPEPFCHRETVTCPFPEGPGGLLQRVPWAGLDSHAPCAE